jgi:sugar lactone lactonase YvrE
MALVIIGACGIAPAPPPVPTPLGQPPSYGPGRIDPVPNLKAVDRLIWMPGLDQGWVPQGLAVAGNSVLVSAYRSLATWRDRGPCRVFRVDPSTGTETGYFDVPPPCGHAGGLATAGGGTLFLADTHALFEVDLEEGFAGRAPKFRFLRLGRGLVGAFAVSGKGAIWIGGYREHGPARAFRFDLGSLERLADGARLEAAAASAVIPIPSYAQGGAVDRSGRLWLARSDIGWGFLDRLDAATGRFDERYRVSAGIEGIAVDEAGRLWGVGEDGARHFPWRYPFFPVIFRLDPQRLVASE